MLLASALLVVVAVVAISSFNHALMVSVSLLRLLVAVVDVIIRLFL